MADQTKLPRVIVSISGGALSAVYCDQPIELYLFDWDNIEVGGWADAKEGLAGFRDHGDLCVLDGETFEKLVTDYVKQAAETQAEQAKLKEESE